MDILTKNKELFKNPNALPLNKVYLHHKTVLPKKSVLPEDSFEGQDSQLKWEDRFQVKTEKKLALDACWIQQGKRYVKFHPYFPQFSDIENKQFLEQNQEFLSIIDDLLCCSYQQFWCYIVCEPQIAFILHNFLENAVSHCSFQHLHGQFLDLYNKIFISVRNVYDRLLKCYLSKHEHMSEEIVMGFLSDILHINDIFMLCYLYNQFYPEFIKKLIAFCTKNNENFIKNVRSALVVLTQEFNKLEALDLLSATHPSSLRRKPNQFDPAWLHDTSLYVVELTATLKEFISVYTPALDILFDLDFPQSLPHIYQKLYTQFYKCLENNVIVYDWSRYRELINEWLALGRFQFVNLFYEFTSFCCSQILNSRAERSIQDTYFENYLDLMSTALEDEFFITDYKKTYFVESQLQMIADSIDGFDSTQTEYLLQSLHRATTIQDNGLIKSTVSEDDVKEMYPEELYESIYDTLSHYFQVQQALNNDETKFYPEPVVMALKQYAELVKQSKTNLLKTDEDLALKLPEESKPSHSEIEYRIKSVLEMLPNLGAGFVLKCLEKMNYEPQQVVARVLDDDLPTDLLGIPRDTIRASDVVGAGSSHPSETKHVVAYYGKKPGYADAKDLLDAKTPDIKDLVLKASYKYDVDDDYDDRNEVYQPFENNESASDCQISSSDEEAEQPRLEKSKNFCEDPAVLRAQREAQRGKNYRGTNRDVVGKPKGQGQDKNVAQNRERKNVSKSTRGNHNRRGGAQWKRSRGMIPS